MLNKIINFFKDFSKPTIFLGVLPDTRPQEERELDPLHEEVASGVPNAPWTVKTPDQWKRYTLRDQNLFSYDCVAFSSSTGVQADLNLSFPLSARDIYDRRSNYPNPGMIPIEGVSIPTSYGVLPDSDLPSDGLIEQQLNVRVQRTPEMAQKALRFSGGIPVKLISPDIDTVAHLISQGMTVRICFHFSEKEWTATPQLISDGNIHHQVLGTDWAIVNGKKCIIIQDSCLLNSTYIFPHGLRVITEDFFNARCYAATYIKKAAPVTPLPIPQHVFTLDMRYGDFGSEVTLLQTKLQALGFFHVAPTGYFGGLTKQAVIAFQESKRLPQTGFCGPLTRAALNVTQA